MNVPVLGEHINCRRVIGAVTNIKSLHLWHEVEEEATYPLLAFWKPKAKKQIKCINKIANKNLCKQERKLEQKLYGTGAMS